MSPVKLKSEEDINKTKRQISNMFQKFKNIDTAVRQLRSATLLVVGSSVLVSVFAIYWGFDQVSKMQNRIYILSGDQALEAIATDRKANPGVEVKAHIRNFHQLFFSLEPDEKAILSNMNKAFYLADGSAKQLYDNLKEAGYFANIISGNVSQSINIDSIQVDMSSYPFHWKCWATEKLLRATTVTTRNLITNGLIRNSGRSDNNAHGYLIEKLQVMDNRDLLIQNRQL